MIKYYCDKCGEEITSDRVNVKLKCRALIGTTELDITMHKTCATEFIGREAIKAEEKRKEEYLARIAERRAKGEKNEIQQPESVGR